MVALVKEYIMLLEQGVAITDQLLALYNPDQHVPRDWADISLSDTRNQRRSFAERLADPPVELTAEETSSLALSIRQYMDAHWADYQEYPIADATKRLQLEEFHKELKAVADAIGQLYNLVRRP